MISSLSRMAISSATNLVLNWDWMSSLDIDRVKIDGAKEKRKRNTKINEVYNQRVYSPVK